MPRWRASTDLVDEAGEVGESLERGSAALEFILVGVVLLVPLLYLIVTMGLIQGQSLGAEAGARHIARAVSLASGSDTAQEAADRISRAVVDEYGLDPTVVRVSMECRPAGLSCPQAGATVVVTMRTTVVLPLIPPVLGLDQLARIPLEASAVQKVSRFWIDE
jgi:Flp pilus assembly protein TadG